eukprot:SAG31_NODE_19334_length_605_cov_1.310277_1_plen_133_part_10
MIMSAAEENRARNRCPLVNKVVETASLSAKAGKTQDLLEKAWKMFQENEQDEKERKSEDWTRDDAICGILTEVRELAEARHHAHEDGPEENSHRTSPFHALNALVALLPARDLRIHQCRLLRSILDLFFVRG